MTLFNYVPYDFIGHLTFQMRKVLVAGNSNEATRYSPLGEGGGQLGTRLLSLH